ncbi:MAG: hypothetical protein JJU27_19620, partial [Gammaproteobacteria bacterium]|nr:hypothetical protein [Gammaproteobacteria bacterium]
TSLTLYRGGELDVALNVPVNRIEWLRRNLGPALRPEAVAGIYYILLNNTRPPFDDRRVRKALSLAIDRDVITGSLLTDGSRPAYNLVPPAMPGYGDNAMEFANWPMDRRREVAKQLLAEAGFTQRNPLRFEFNFGGLEENRRLAVAFQAMWRSIGIDVNVVNRGSQSIVRAARSGEYDAMRYIYYAAYEDPMSLLELIQGGSILNFSGYTNPEFDEALRQTDLIADPEERLAALRAAEQLGMAEHPVIPVFFKYRYYLVRPSIDGWVSNLSGRHLSRYLSFNGSQG